MSARGEYRPIFSVIVDTPEFQELSADARLLWFTLKLSLGALGIAVAYDDQLCERSGLTPVKMRAARRELEVEETWLLREGRIHWLRNGLRYEPNITLSNENHRVFAAKEMFGLPKAQIVNRFALYYEIEPPFPDLPTPEPPRSGPDVAPPIPSPSPPPSPSDGMNGGHGHLKQGIGRGSEGDSKGIAMGSEGDRDGMPDPKPFPLPLPLPPLNLPNPRGAALRSAAHRQRRASLPEDWQPNEGHGLIATEAQVDLRREAENFRDHAKATGRLMLDWDAAFRTWLRKAPQYANGGGVRAGPGFGNETLRDQKRTEEARHRASHSAAEERERREQEVRAEEAELRAWLEGRGDVERKAVERDAAARVKTMLQATGGKMRDAMTTAALLSATKDARTQAQRSQGGAA